MGEGSLTHNDSYIYLIDAFSEDEIVSRYAWIYDMIQEFIRVEKLGDRVAISDEILNHVVIDYFVDIKRVKDFSHIDQEHDSKIYAYLAYWLLRHKPIQVVEGCDEGLAFVNEDFVENFLMEYLFNDPADVSISKIKREDIDNFLETLVYYFKYRHYDAQSLEMIILAFIAGRGYQYSVDYRQ